MAYGTDYGVSELLKRKRQAMATGQQFLDPNEIAGYIQGVNQAGIAKNVAAQQLSLQERARQDTKAYNQKVLDIEEDKAKAQERADTIGGVLAAAETAGKGYNAYNYWANKSRKPETTSDTGYETGTNTYTGGISTTTPAATTPIATTPAEHSYLSTEGRPAGAAAEGQYSYDNANKNTNWGKGAGNALDFAGGYSGARGQYNNKYSGGTYEGGREFERITGTGRFYSEGDDWSWKNDPMAFHAGPHLSTASNLETTPRGPYGRAGAGTGMGFEMAGRYFDTKEEAGADLTGGEKLIQNIADETGKIICTELHRQGYMPDEIYDLDAEFGKRQNIVIMRGYHTMAIPIVNLMKKSKAFTWAVSKLALPWAYEMARVMNPDKFKGNIIGKLIMEIGIPLCIWVGSRKEVKHGELLS